MVELRSWFQRVEGVANAEGLGVDAVCKRLNISRGTYYIYRNDSKRHPRSRDVVQAIADFLHEDEAALSEEMSATTPSPSSFLEAAAAREMVTQLYQQHVRALAHVLGMGALDEAPAAQQSSETTPALGSGPRDTAMRAQGVDVVVRLLREQLRLPPDPIDAAVVVLPKTRGGTKELATYGRPYQFQIYVLPEALADAHLPSWAPALLERTRAKVDVLMSGTLLPVTREHSRELALTLFSGRADLLLYPGLLDMRPPGLSGPSHDDPSDILVMGVYYAGAPDVAALLADGLGHGFCTFDQLARLQTRAGLRGLPDNRLEQATARIARSVVAGQSPTAGPMVWATNDPEAVLTRETRTAFRAYPGTLVVLQLADDAVDYAAYRVACVSDQRSDEEYTKWRDRLRRQQEQLLEMAGQRDPSSRTLVKTIDLPTLACRQPDGGYPDAVDAFFDLYGEAATAVAEELRRG